MSGVATAIAVGTGVNYLGQREARKAQQAAQGASIEQLRPYTEFGYEQLDQLKNYLAGPRSPFAPISVEDVMQSPEYQAGLQTMESSAAARGGLKSGNFLRRVSQELAPLGIERERQRRLSELQARNALLQTGYGAAAGGANVYSGMAPGIAQSTAGQYGALAGGVGDVAGYLGQRQAMSDWTDFLNQYNAPTTPYPAGSVPAGYQVGPVR